jgi:hypothetical protein
MKLSRRQVGAGAAALLASKTARASPFDADAVSNQSPLRSVLWSWTTPEQVRELRDGSPLFTRVTNKDGERGYLYTVLQKKNGLAADLLRGKRFDKGRFGWWNPWATCDGFFDEKWGERLLRLELVPEAWLAVVRSSQPEPTVFDLDNRPVSKDQLEGQPQRLAGAFFIHDQLNGDERWWCNPSIGGWARFYREVYLGDESLIRGWSIDTPQIRERLTSAADRLEALASRTDGNQFWRCQWQQRTLADWDERSRPADAFTAYRRSLAFSSPEYNEDAGTLKHLATLLRQRVT